MGPLSRLTRLQQITLISLSDCHHRLGDGLDSRLLTTGRALHKKSWAVMDRPYSLGCATVGALYERPRCIFCAKPTKRHKNHKIFPFLCFWCLFVANNSFVDVNCSSPLHEDRNMAKKNDSFNPSRRKFIKGAALTVGTTGLAGAGQEVNAAPQARVQW